jgi:DNA-binding winged helix-turn-helix (wHTH) protein
LIFRIEKIVLDTSRRQLLVGGALRPIEPQVFDLLAYLLENHERVVGRDELLTALGEGRTTSDAVLSTRLSAARSAIGDNGIEQRLIRTFRGKGLRFVGAVTKLNAPIEPAAAAQQEVPDVAIRAPGEPHTAWHVVAAVGAIFTTDAMQVEQLTREIGSGIILGLSALI